MSGERPRAYSLLARGLFALTWLVPGTGAATAPLELDWSAPEECPNASFVREEMTRVVGRPWSEIDVEWKQSRALITREAGGYRVRVSVVTEGGVSERSVVAASCTEATEAAVAILIASVALVPAPERDPAPPAARAEKGRDAAHDALLETPAVAPEQGASHPAVPLLAASVGLDIGSLAAAAPFAQLSSGFELGHFSALGLVGATGSVLGEIDGVTAGAQMFLWMAGVLGCGKVNAQNPIVSGCGGVELGSLEAHGFGTADRRGRRALWSAGVARVALDWNIGNASLVSLGTDAVVPFRHLQVVAGVEEVHRTPSVALRPWLGLGLRFR